jgi:hypothetical protein
MTVFEWILTQHFTGPAASAGSLPELLWRVGRASLQSDDPPAGEIVASMSTSWPALGLIGIIDNSMAGVHIYTEDGLYVDSAFVPGEYEQRSLFGLPGEFFAGRLFHNTEDGHVYMNAVQLFFARFPPVCAQELCQIVLSPLVRAFAAIWNRPLGGWSRSNEPNLTLLMCFWSENTA